jgi:hypothetical protein
MKDALDRGGWDKNYTIFHEVADPDLAGTEAITRLLLLLQHATLKNQSTYCIDE